MGGRGGTGAGWVRGARGGVAIGRPPTTAPPLYPFLCPPAQNPSRPLGPMVKLIDLGMACSYDAARPEKGARGGCVRAGERDCQPSLPPPSTHTHTRARAPSLPPSLPPPRPLKPPAPPPPGALGSAGFVAPDVVRGGVHTPAMDVFSLGAMLFVMLVRWGGMCGVGAVVWVGWGGGRPHGVAGPPSTHHLPPPSTHPAAPGGAQALQHQAERDPAVRFHDPAGRPRPQRPAVRAAGGGERLYVRVCVWGGGDHLQSTLRLALRMAPPRCPPPRLHTHTPSTPPPTTHPPPSPTHPPHMQLAGPLP